MPKILDLSTTLATFGFDPRPPQIVYWEHRECPLLLQVIKCSVERVSGPNGSRCGRGSCDHPHRHPSGCTLAFRTDCGRQACEDHR